MCESLDRLSRDQEDIANLYKRTQFANVKIITLTEGEISPLHIGLKGTMNAIYLKDLADKTKRGQQGNIRAGKFAGGIAYGYNTAKRFDAHGNPLRGYREINETEAQIIRRIFQEYGYQGKSPKRIAAKLNGDGIPSPSGKSWVHSTINGNRKRGIGILNNDLYRGILVWNRQHFIKDPFRRKRVSRCNPEHEWLTQAVPHLRIVSDELWQAAKTRHTKLDAQPSINRSCCLILPSTYGHEVKRVLYT